jgi:hypothetical protein
MHDYLNGALKVDFDIDFYGNTVVVGAKYHDKELDLSDDEVYEWVTDTVYKEHTY